MNVLKKLLLCLFALMISHSAYCARSGDVGEDDSTAGAVESNGDPCDFAVNDTSLGDDSNAGGEDTSGDSINI